MLVKNIGCMQNSARTPQLLSDILCEVKRDIEDILKLWGNNKLEEIPLSAIEAYGELKREEIKIKQILNSCH